jgi:hypothetical protein
MDDTPCRLFFLQPTSDAQRLYEALHAVFVDGCRQKDVADRFTSLRRFAAFRLFLASSGARPGAAAGAVAR